MIDGVSGLLAVISRLRAADVRSASASNSSGRAARSRSCSRRKIPMACADRSSMPPGATSSPNGGAREETWDMLQLALRLGENPRQLVTTTPRPIPLLRQHARRPGDCDLAHAHGGQRGEPGRTVHRRDAPPLRRHRARPAGTRRRDHRGLRRRAVAARLDRGAAARSTPRRTTSQPKMQPHRRRGRSAGHGDGELGRVRHRRRGPRRGQARLRARRPHAAGPRSLRLGARGDHGVARIQRRPHRRGGQPGRRSRRRGDPADRQRACRSPLVRATRGKYVRAEPIAALYAEGRVVHVGHSRNSRRRC